MSQLIGDDVQVAPDELAAAVAGQVAGGGRFAGLVASAAEEGGVRLRAFVAVSDRLVTLGAVLAAGQDRFRSLTPSVPGAFWYEREIHDLFGLVADGHPRLDPLVFPLPGAGRRPGVAAAGERLDPDVSALPGHVRGEGVFTIPYGPVRSGVFETIEYLVETAGEDIPHLRVRPYLKHRGVARRFGDLSVDDGVLLAERVEGTMSVAHAWAFCQAVELITDVDVPPAAQAQRIVHAELERVANHLDSMVRHTEGAGQAVAYARLSRHKEGVLRLQARLCGHRFGRGVVVPGGTTGPPLVTASAAAAEARQIRADLDTDLGVLMTTPSFLDRLRSTGPLAVDVARAHGALGPVGRGSGSGDDVRATRPYGGYEGLDLDVAVPRGGADALTRQWIRVDEITAAWRLVLQALDRLGASPDSPWRAEVPPADGSAIGWVEAPQGELLYQIDVVDGRLQWVKPRTASFHNLALFSAAFGGDILTDFVFIEASFGVNMAGVAG